MCIMAERRRAAGVSLEEANASRLQGGFDTTLQDLFLSGTPVPMHGVEVPDWIGGTRR
jgi:hypothetical protein